MPKLRCGPAAANFGAQSNARAKSSRRDAVCRGFFAVRAATGARSAAKPLSGENGFFYIRAPD
jgi:hypothetical protein